MTLSDRFYNLLPAGIQAAVDKHLPSTKNKSINIFFSPPGGGSVGFSIGKTLAETKNTQMNFAATYTWYWQLLPKNNKVVPFR